MEVTRAAADAKSGIQSHHVSNYTFFVRKFLVHLRTVNASSQKLARPLIRYQVSQYCANTQFCCSITRPVHFCTQIMRDASTQTGTSCKECASHLNHKRIMRNKTRTLEAIIKERDAKIRSLERQISTLILPLTIVTKWSPYFSNKFEVPILLWVYRIIVQESSCMIHT